MAKADAMVRAYAKAGFTKIHLDCSEGCAGEPAQLSDDQTVPRAAALARAAVETVPADRLLFVVGTEVPPPGGARPGDHGIVPTRPEAARATLDAHVDGLPRPRPHRRPRRPAGRGVRRHGGPPPPHGPRPRPARGRRPPRRRRAGGPLHRLPAPRGLPPPRGARLRLPEGRPRADLRLARGGLRARRARPDRRLDRPGPLRVHGDRHARRSPPLAAPPRLQGAGSFGSSAISPTPTASATTGPSPRPRPRSSACAARCRASASPTRSSTRASPTAVLDRAEPLRAELPAPDALLQACVQEALAPYFFPDA